MQNVSANFKTTALSADQTPVRSVTLTLLDNNIVGTSNLSASAPSIDSTVVGASNAVNGTSKLGRRWGLADNYDTVAAGARCLAEVDTNANVVYPVDTTEEAGWWGSALADVNGNIGGGGEVFVVTYSGPQTILTITLWADTYLGYPVNFTIDYDPTGSAGYTNIANVVGNTSTNYIYTFNAATKVTKIRVTITKVSLPFTVAKLIELEGGLTVDVSLNVGQQSIIAERLADNATLQLGSASANEIDLSIDQTAGLWGPNNANSPYQAYLKSNRKIKPKVGFKYGDGTTELIPLGTFYSMNWNAPLGGPTARVKAQDRMKRLRERKYRNCPLSANLTVDQIIKQALIDAGLNTSDWVLNASTIIIPYAWCTPTQSFFDYVSALAGAAGGVVYFDESDVFHFEDATYLKTNRLTSVITLTDANAVITADDNWDEGQVKNRIVVSVNALKLAASTTIWSLQETLTVLPGAQLTINITFGSASTNVQAPVITGGADISQVSWTVYAMTAVLVVKNNGTASENITAMTVAGQALTADGANIIIAEDSSLVAQDGARELSVNNTYMQQRSPATTLAYNLLSIYKNPPARIKIECVGLPHLELGDRITINSTSLGVNQDYWVTRHSFTDDGGFHSSIDAVAVFSQLGDRATMWHRSAIVLVGNSLLEQIDTLKPYAHVVYQNPPANGDTTTNAFFIESGLYSLYMLGWTAPDGGKVDVYIDDVLLTSGVDWYGPSIIAVQSIQVVVTTDGYHTLKLVVNGKNTASINYFVRLAKIWLKLASDTYTLDLSNYSTALPTRARLWHEDSTVLTGNALIPGVNSSQAYSAGPEQSPAANGDSFTQSFFMKAGTYTFSVLGYTNTNRGMIDWYIDNVLVVSGQDWYAALTFNVVKTASVTVSGSGYHTLKGVVNGKNASSTGYQMTLTKMWLKQASD